MPPDVKKAVIVEYDVPAHMRDGIVLRANVYRPADEEKWPVILLRIPYGKDLPIAVGLFDPARMAVRGYVVIIQDTRGRYASEGEWEPYRFDAQDGVDTIAWAASLPYSNGRVGMFGASYSGFTQWAAALQQPGALKAIVPMISAGDPLEGRWFRGGAFSLGSLANWYMQSIGPGVVMRGYRSDPQSSGVSLPTLVREIDALGTQGYWSLPLKEFAPLRSLEIAPTFFEPLEHPMDRALADYLDVHGKYQQVQVPALNIGGWYDIYLRNTITHFKGLREHGSTPSARQSKLLIGPWGHRNRTNAVGELNFGFAANSALIDLQSSLEGLHANWFDHWLKGVENGITDGAPIKLFVMGANTWRDEQAWPLARAVETCYYLHSAGHANTLDGDGVLSTVMPQGEPVDRYSYDPARPVLTHGGALLMTSEFPAGPYDQRVVESRADVLVYSTPALEQDLEVTGPIIVRLWAISSAPDTDFVARLVDVYPDGRAFNLTDGIIRARYRGFARGEAISLIEPGRAYEYEIDLWATSNVFKRGHRIRLDITSSCFPRWDRNPNTGHDLGVDDELAVAGQTILHDAEHPSYITLPVVPADS